MLGWHPLKAQLSRERHELSATSGPVTFITLTDPPIHPEPMTTTPHQPQRKATAVLGWFPTTPTTEREILDMANSRQVTLRTRLRHLYWLTECKPISPLVVASVRRKMVMIDPQDAMPEEQVDELLSPHFGFEKVTDAAGAFVGWRLPDLDAALQDAVGAIEAKRARMSALSIAGVAKRAALRKGASPMAGPYERAHAPEPIDQSTGELMTTADDGNF